MSLSPWWFDPFDRPRPPRWWDWESRFWTPSIRRGPTDVVPQGSAPQVQLDENKFQVSVDVQQFSPEEITVKTSGDDTIIIEGKHEERPDEHGFVSRQFVRKYVLPKGHDINKVASSLSSDGVLTITAPRVESVEGQEKRVPIMHTGAPAKAVEEQK